eukprot:1159326-Pelagomonas_calceolata.AAC.3
MMFNYIVVQVGQMVAMEEDSRPGFGLGRKNPGPLSKPFDGAGYTYDAYSTPACSGPMMEAS